ncbi:hypothetical protein QJU96_07290 [Pasteurella skyensis]|uniref:Uncharacterized protein n=1 Tax=Phocoenobacter skyensis TaxID=97481 RepID=A0AAJ6P1N2_9PAST|nr:hypothetical protein [Pasteurella skyensis]MDP8171090.1 hypothetical protein [Pasteurella skyensis]MDP8173879.1 hypothetical protein [Pasteurella skyensis]
MNKFTLSLSLFVLMISTSIFANNGIITTIPDNLGNIYNSKNFNRYTKVTTPNGGSIHIVVQSHLTDEQIIRCRNVLQHYLTDYKGSKYGSDKSAVANKMAENNAILVLLNGQDDGSNPIADKVTGQPLYENEIQVEGHSWYMKQDYAHRDATFEEILHFVHDNGIGVDGNDDFLGALPKYQANIRTAQKNGLAKNLWGRGSENKNWVKELANENSLTQEYLASVVDSYYGLWGAWKEGDGGMWDIYIAKTREDIKSKDPMGYALMNKQFFHPYLTYNARIDANLKGNFSLKFDPLKPYTHHSRYLKDITLLGTNNNSVTVNELDNNIIGNIGVNTVIFSGKFTEYKITQNNGTIIVKDKISNRDRLNTLSHIEKLQFQDKTVNLK